MMCSKDDGVAGGGWWASLRWSGGKLAFPWQILKCQPLSGVFQGSFCFSWEGVSSAPQGRGVLGWRPRRPDAAEASVGGRCSPDCIRTFLFYFLPLSLCLTSPRGLWSLLSSAKVEEERPLLVPSSVEETHSSISQVVERTWKPAH